MRVPARSTAVVFQLAPDPGRAPLAIAGAPGPGQLFGDGGCSQEGPRRPQTGASGGSGGGGGAATGASGRRGGAAAAASSGGGGGGRAVTRRPGAAVVAVGMQALCTCGQAVRVERAFHGRLDGERESMWEQVHQTGPPPAAAFLGSVLAFMLGASSDLPASEQAVESEDSRRFPWAARVPTCAQGGPAAPCKRAQAGLGSRAPRPTPGPVSLQAGSATRDGQAPVGKGTRKRDAPTQRPTGGGEAPPARANNAGGNKAHAGTAGPSPSAYMSRARDPHPHCTAKHEPEAAKHGIHTTIRRAPRAARSFKASVC